MTVHSLRLTFEAVQPSARYSDGEVRRSVFFAYAFKGRKPKGGNGYCVSEGGRELPDVLTEAETLRKAALFAAATAERLNRLADQLEAST